MVVRSALANGMDWQALDDLVKAETANGNPIASLIHELRLDTNKASRVPEPPVSLSFTCFLISSSISSIVAILLDLSDKDQQVPLSISSRLRAIP